MTQSNQRLNDETKQSVQTPFQGSEGLIKSLLTLPDNGSDARESLLEQVIAQPQEAKPTQSTQDSQGGKGDTK